MIIAPRTKEQLEDRLRRSYEPYGGCLCIGCLENRIGRKLKPRDFTRHTFNDMPGTDRLLERREG